MEIKKVNAIFNDCYQLYKRFYSLQLNDDDLHEFVKAVDVIRRKYLCQMADDLLTTVIDEIDRIEKSKVR